MTNAQFESVHADKNHTCWQICNLEFLFLGEVQFSKNLSFSTNLFSPRGCIKLVLLITRLEILHAKQVQANIADLVLLVLLRDYRVQGLNGGCVVDKVMGWGPHPQVWGLRWDIDGCVFWGVHAG